MRSDGSESAYLADNDEDDAAESHKAMVDLSFATLNTFLNGKLVSTGSQQKSSRESGKKRVYNNTNRAAAAEEAKRLRGTSTRTRVPRNSEDT